MYDVRSTTAKERSHLKVVLDGKKIPCDVVDVDFNPALFGIAPAKGWIFREIDEDLSIYAGILL